MDEQLLAIVADPHLIEITLCVGLIWVLGWIQSMR
jgi:hypothetical protein